MPCWETTTVEIAWKPEGMDLVLVALESLGYQVTRTGFLFATKGQDSVTFDGAHLIVEVGKEHLVNPIKRAYAQAAVNQAAKRFGWQVRQTKPQQYRLERR